MAKLLIVLLVLGGFFWGLKRPATETERVSGFVSVPAPTQQEAGSVLIVAAENCPKAAAQHADYLTRQLQKKKIKVQRVNSVDFTYRNQAEAKAIQDLMSAGPPFVFVKGYGSTHPSLESVLEATEKL